MEQIITAIKKAGGLLWALRQVHFHDPLYLLVLILLVPLLFVAIRHWRRRPRVQVSLGARLKNLPTSTRSRLLWLPEALIVLSFVVAAIALARPQLPGQPAPLDAEGIDIAIALDVSTSMKAADFKPKDRIHVAKQTIADMIEQRSSDRIALVVFAGEAFTQAPLTLDYDLLREVLSGVKTGVIKDGTAIGDAIATSLNRVRGGQAKSKVVILVTDGDNNSGTVPPMEAARMAKEIGVKVYPILVGRGGRVPYPAGPDLFGGSRFVYREIPTNPQLLKDIAKTSDGRFYKATDREALRGSFQDILSRMDKSRLKDAKHYSRQVELASIFIWAALWLLLLALVLRSTWLRSLP